MRTIRMSDAEDYIVGEMRAGKVFIYPTDTIYGIGCNALDEKAVRRVFDIKKRDYSKPVSVIAPSFEWISKNCVCDINRVRKYLPGPYTVILRLKDEKMLKTASSGTGKIGIRILNHQIMKIFEKAGVPFVTTSVNLSGERHVHEISEADVAIAKLADYAIDDGRIEGRPSTIIDMSEDAGEKVIKR